MSVTKLNICNLALSHLGLRAVANLTDSHPSVTALNNAYDPCIEDVFSEYNWPFANVEEVLVESSEEFLGWDYVYEYPTTAARVWNVFNEGCVDTKGDQEFEVRFVSSTGVKVICTNLSDAYAEYTYIITDTTLYDAKFVMALSLRIAAMIAHSLTGSPDLGLKATELYNIAISEAKRLGYAERRKVPKQTSSSQASRG